MADAMAVAPQMIERLDWSADRLAAHRQQKLRAIVAHAVVGSPWHRERLAGVDLLRLDEDTLRGLPTMTKGDLMGNFDWIASDPRLTLAWVNAHFETVEENGYLFDRYTAITSGGSSGERGVLSTTGRAGRPLGSAASATCSVPASPIPCSRPAR